MREDDGTEPDGHDGVGWADRLAETAAQAGDLLKTRVQIFREEAAQKALHAARGAAGMAVAVALAIGAVLLFGAFVAAVLAKLLNSVPLGILAAFVLYAALAALFAWRAAKVFAQVRPGDFPVTRDELRRDAEGLRASLSFDGAEEGDEDEEERDEPARTVTRSAAEVEDLEARFRAGAE